MRTLSFTIAYSVATLKVKRWQLGPIAIDVWPLKAAQLDSISNLTFVGASNLSCIQTQCRYI